MIWLKVLLKMQPETENSQQLLIREDKILIFTCVIEGNFTLS